MPYKNIHSERASVWAKNHPEQRKRNSSCNEGIGQLKHSKDLLFSAISYLSEVR